MYPGYGEGVLPSRAIGIARAQPMLQDPVSSVHGPIYRVQYPGSSIQVSDVQISDVQISDVQISDVRCQMSDVRVR